MSSTKSQRSNHDFLPSIISASPSKSSSALKHVEIQTELKQIKDSIGKKSKYYLKEAHTTDTADQSDFYDDAMLSWCDRHGLKVNFKSNLQQKRKFRKWFNALDRDGGGTVGIKELIDPLLSTGIMKTTEDVYRMLSEVDEDKSGEISFDEFIRAISGKKFFKKEQLKTLGDLSKEDNSFSMDMMLSIARRRNLIKKVVTESSERLAEVEKALAHNHGGGSTGKTVMGKTHKDDSSKISHKSNHHANNDVLRDLLSVHHEQKRATCRYLEGLEGVIDAQLRPSGEESNNSSPTPSHFYRLNAEVFEAVRGSSLDRNDSDELKDFGVDSTQRRKVDLKPIAPAGRLLQKSTSKSNFSRKESGSTLAKQNSRGLTQTESALTIPEKFKVGNPSGKLVLRRMGSNSLESLSVSIPIKAEVEKKSVVRRINDSNTKKMPSYSEHYD
jgi:predicted CopG family antitoxin